MMLAQKLYEGVEIGKEGQVGLITYMRTDSVRVSMEAINEARSYIEKAFGAPYVPQKPNFYKNKKSARTLVRSNTPRLCADGTEKVKDYSIESSCPL